jgi:hypothetical protein
MLAISPKCNPITMITTAIYTMKFQAFELNNQDGTTSNIGITWNADMKVLQSITRYDLMEDGRFSEVSIDLNDTQNEPFIDQLKSLI